MSPAIAESVARTILGDREAMVRIIEIALVKIRKLDADLNAHVNANVIGAENGLGLHCAIAEAVERQDVQLVDAIVANGAMDSDYIQYEADPDFPGSLRPVRSETSFLHHSTTP